MTLQDHGIDISKIRGSNGKTICPKCSSTRKNKKDLCLSVNIEKKIWLCHNCGWTGGIRSETKKEYFRPLPPEYKFSEKVRQWFEKRGISAYTLQRYQIASEEKFVPQIQLKRECILFPYIRNEVLVNIKYRDAQKHFFMVKDAELIFFGMDVCGDTDEVGIVEGENDCMAFYEAGVYNTVSVPNGASKGNARMEYLDNCWQWFENKKKIFIATDNDEPGSALREELIRRFGKDRCYIVNFFDCKDANEVLMVHGKDHLKQLLLSALPLPLEGVIQVSDITDEVDRLHVHGYPKSSGVGYLECDDLIKWAKGEMTIITGVPNSGKSSWLDQILMLLAARLGWRFGIFSPENPISYHISKMSSLFMGKSFYANENKISTEQLHLSYEFLNDHFYFMEYTKLDLTVDGLIEKAVEMVKRFGIDGFVFDPYNYIEHNIPHGYTETQYISEVLTKFNQFKRKYNAHVWIVAHPTKMSKDDSGSEYKVVTPYNIQGSSHFFNKTDNAISVWRSLQQGYTQVYIQKIRFPWMGKLGSARFDYEVSTGRYREQGKEFPVAARMYLNRMEMNNEYGLTDDYTSSRITPAGEGREGNTF